MKNNRNNLFSNTNLKNLNLSNHKRISLKLSASATVEATLIFPLVILFFMSVIWIVDLFYIHSTIGFELDSVGKELVSYSYPYKMYIQGGEESGELNGILSSVGWNEGYVKSRLNKTEVSTRVSSLTTLLSDFSSDDIDIVVTYFVEPILKIPGVDGVFLTNHFFSKPYSGYSKGRATESDKRVYVTRTGSVYHTSLNCRSLKTTIISVAYDGVSAKRNEAGSKYYSCELCGRGNHGSVVYITPTGNRYHNSASCSELKTDIFEICLSEAGGRGKCKYCD